MNCKICGNSLNNKIFIVKEMMLGLEEDFDYLWCRKCGCLQLINIPKNMSKYYPSNYYSYSNTNESHNFFKKYFIKQRDKTIIEDNKNLLGVLLNVIKPAPNLVNILSSTQIDTNSRILDVGSGHGIKMKPLVNLGYNVIGIDPYLEEDEIVIDNLRIYKKDIFGIEGKWDLIILNHVFEHLENPIDVLKRINYLLSPQGICLIRTPIIPCYIWEEYKTNWIQIDPPRHFYIFSHKSIKLLSEQTGLKINKVIYDSTPFQFLGSELNKRGISINKRDYRLNRQNNIFSFKEIKYFIRKTKELNKNDDGDQVAFILSKY